MTAPIRIAVTGAGGQIGYALSSGSPREALWAEPAGFASAPGNHPALPSLNGTLMELEDGFPLLTDVMRPTRRPRRSRGADWVDPGRVACPQGRMSRADLIRANGPILPADARRSTTPPAERPDLRPWPTRSNTNCLIAKSHAPKIPADCWFAMTRLDQNRAAAQLAQKAGVPVRDVTNMTIWGNHSDTRIPTTRTPRSAVSRRPRSSPTRPGSPSSTSPGVAKRLRRDQGRVPRRRPRRPTPRSTASACSRPAGDDWFSTGAWSPTAATASRPV